MSKRTAEEKELYLQGRQVCNICGEEKPLEDFSKEPRNWNGYFRGCKACWLKRSTASRRLKSTGWTQEEYDRVLEEQGGVCAICKLVDPRGSLAGDHCHATGDKRGLLCRSCNQGLGSFKDDPVLLRAAAAYMEMDQEED